MALFLARSQFARSTRHHYRFSSRFFSTTAPEMSIPTFEDPNKYLNREEERNEKQRKVQQVVKNALFLSCDSTAKGGVCDIYVLGVMCNFSRKPRISIQALQAIMSYLNPQVLFLQVPDDKSAVALLDRHIEFENFSATDIVKAIMNKPIRNFGALIAWGMEKRFKTSLCYAAYREAIKSGREVVLGDRSEEMMTRFLPRFGLSGTSMLKMPMSQNIINERTERYKKVQELAEDVVGLTCNSTAKGGICEVYLLGTRHFSPESQDEVRELMHFLKPPESSEFYMANNIAKMNGSKVVLGDRHFLITKVREKIQKTFKLLQYYCGLLPKDIDSWDAKRLAYFNVFLDERDIYMTRRLLTIAEKSSLVLEIVGKKHLPGMTKLWMESTKRRNNFSPGENVE